jgi:FAD/FMN-containing dehydrogenase
METPMTAAQEVLTIPGFTGTVIRPGDSSYDTARAIWNAMHDRRPELIALATSPQDVAAAVRYGRDRGLPIAVRCGGHSMPGHSVVDDGIVIDLRAINAVDVDPVARRVTVGGGALLGELDQATQAHGLVVPSGSVSHTGLGGLVLGGGIGRLMRRFGLTIDSLLSAEVVTADGRILRASPGEHPDLFWGIRGGGGNFGVVTEFEFTLHQLSEMLILGMFHPVADAPAVFARADELMAAGAPDELIWNILGGKAPPLPWITPNLFGLPGVLSLVEWSGDRAEGQARLGALAEELAPAAAFSAPMPHLVMQTLVDDMFGPGLRTYIKAGFAAELPGSLIGALAEQIGRIGSPFSQVEVLGMGGAIARVDPDATAFPHRDARWLFNIHATWDAASADDAEIAWARGAFAVFEPYLTGGTYLNMMSADEKGIGTGPHARTLRRLQAVKAVYDPDNVFRLNQNITPATA